MARIPSNLTNHLLIALPTLDDPEFAGSVALICRHDEDGAMGVIVNRPSGHTLGEVLMQMQLHSNDEMVNRKQVLSGGPVHPERGFVLHDGDDEWQSSLEVGNGLRLTTSRDVLAAMAAGNGPRNALLMLGCAGWDAGQLERELGEDAWLTAPADVPLLFEVPWEQRWIAAGNRIGVDMIHLAGYSGHA